MLLNAGRHGSGSELTLELMLNNGGATIEPDMAIIDTYEFYNPMLAELRQRILFEVVYEILATDHPKTQQQTALMQYAEAQRLTLAELVKAFVEYIKRKALLVNELLVDLSDVSEQKEADLEQIEAKNTALRGNLERIRTHLERPKDNNGELVVDLDALEAELRQNLVDSEAIRNELARLRLDRSRIKHNLEQIKLDNKRIELGLYRLKSLLE